MNTIRLVLHLLGLWPELFGCILACSTCWCIGFGLARRLGLPFTALEEKVYAGVLGCPCVSLIVFGLGVTQLFYTGVFLALAALSLGFAFVARRRWPRPATPVVRDLAPWQKIVFLAVYAFFTLHYLWVALAPEVSFDGSTYHTGLIARYLRDHGFIPIYTNSYAGMPQGAESLYLIAFAFGRNSAAALVHSASWLLLPWVVMCVFRRLNRPGAGVLAALLLFTSPLVALDGVTAYVDVLLITVLIAMFGLFEIWFAERTLSLAFGVALLSGYAVAVKYTAFPAPVYVCLVMAFALKRTPRRAVRHLGVVLVTASVVFVPWLLRSWVFFGDPLFPFASRLFSNPFIHPWSEVLYRTNMQHYAGIESYARLPLELTVHGAALQGFIGPVFLLLPVGLLGLGHPVGRRFFIAGSLFLLPYSQNIGTRFFLPCLVFWTPPMCLALAEFAPVALLVGIFGVVTAWPSVAGKYCNPYAPRVVALPKKVVVGREDPEAYRRRTLGDIYEAAQLVNAHVPSDARVLTRRNIPDGYTRAEVVTSFQGALNERLFSELSGVDDLSVGPCQRAVFHVPAGSWRTFRLMESSDDPLHWANIGELQAYSNGKSVPILPRTVKAFPNRFDASLAIDANVATAWSSWEPIQRQMYLQFAVGGPVDSVGAVMSCGQEAQNWRLLGSLDTQTWTVLDGKPVVSPARPLPHLETDIIDDLKRNDVHYLLLRDGDPLIGDLAGHPNAWPVRLLASSPAYRLYRF